MIKVAALLTAGLVVGSSFLGESRVPSPAQPNSAPQPNSASTADPIAYERITVDIVPLSLDECVELSSHIAELRILDEAHVFRTGEMPYRAYSAAVMSDIKGDLPSVIEIRVAGARSADRVCELRPDVSLAVGSTFLGFLTDAAGEGSYGLVGLSHGVYPILDRDGVPWARGLHAQSGMPVEQLIEEVALRIR